MKRIGVIIETWKLPTFKKHLEAAGYKFTKHPGFVHDTVTLKIKAEFIAPLQKVIEAAQAECRKS